MMKLNKFLFGAAYYPEHWEDSERLKDTDYMKELSFNTVRIGEFAWFLLEPAEGNYDFTFFDKQIDRLAEAGVSVIFGTPTAAPPRWLTEKHPEVLRVDADGRQMKHGSRQHACIASSVFLDYCRKLTEALAEHYRDTEGIIGWQIDNEIYCHIRDCYCDSCGKGFREYLKSKYRTIGELNRNWGNRFWSLDYNSFEQIELPYPDRPTHLNPSHVLDYRLFQSELAVNFIREQYEILKSFRKEWFVTHNGTFSGIDYRKACRYLDVYAHDNYPMFLPREDRAAWAAKNLDAARSFGGNFLIPEEQSGPGGQGDYLQETPLPGGIRLKFWQGVARGAEGILFFRMRTCRYGAEQYWKGILDQDNLINRRYGEVKEIGEEAAKAGGAILGTGVFFDIGILYDTGLPELSHEPITHGLPSPGKFAAMIHGALYRKHYDAGFIHPEDDFSKLRLIFLPSWGVVPDELTERLNEFAESGGKVIITGRSGIKDERNIVHSVPPPGPLAELCGAEAAEAFRIRTSGEWVSRLKDMPVQLWAEKLRVRNAETFWSYNGGALDGEAGCAYRKLGKGGVFYLGTYPTDEMVLALTRETAGNPAEVPEGVEITRRVTAAGDKTFTFVLNHSLEKKTVSGLEPGNPLLGKDTAQADNGFSISPLGVEIFQADK